MTSKAITPPGNQTRPPLEKQFFVGMWQGATQASVTGCIGTLAVTALLFIACFLLVTPDRLASIDPGYWMTIPNDWYTKISFRAMRIARDEPEPCAIVVFGDSGTRELISDWSVIHEAASESMGQPVPVHNLTAGALSLIEMVGIMDLVDDGFNGIVVVQIGQFHLAQTKEELAVVVNTPRLALHTPVYDDELARVTSMPPQRIGIYFADHWRFFSHRLNDRFLRHLFLGLMPEIISDREPPTEEAWGWKTRRIIAYLEKYEDQRDRNRAILDRMFDRLRRQGHVEIVLLEPPLSPKAHRLQSPELAANHRQYVQRWVEEQKLHYWNLNDEAGLAADHYRDYIHVEDHEARSRYTKLLAGKLANLASTSTWGKGAR